MRCLLFCACLVLLASSGVGLAQGKKAPPKVAPPKAAPEVKAAPEAKARFSPEAIELLAAVSSGYELNGKAVAPAMDAAAILRAAESKDAQIRELGRMACQLVYLHSLLGALKPDPEINRIARADLGDLAGDPEKTIAAIVPPADVWSVNARADFIKLLTAGMGAKRPEPAGGKDTLEELIFTGPQQAANKTSSLRLLGQGKAVVLQKKMRALVAEPAEPASALKEPIKVKFLADKNKTVFLAFTNQTKGTLHHVLAFTRVVNDPLRVEKKKNMELATRVLGAGAFGASEENIESAKVGILIDSALMNLERGSLLYVPEIPAGATVRVPLVPGRDAPYVKGAEMSLWADELAVPVLKLGGAPGGSPGEPPPTPVKLDKAGAALVKFQLPKGGPLDPLALGAKVYKAFTVPMTAGKTYDIRVTTTQFGTDLRVEDAAGAVQAKAKGSTTFMNRTLQLEFAPPVDGEYRIICSEVYAGTIPYTLAIQSK